MAIEVKVTLFGDNALSHDSRWRRRALHVFLATQRRPEEQQAPVHREARCQSRWRESADGP